MRGLAGGAAEEDACRPASWLWVPITSRSWFWASARRTFEAYFPACMSAVAVTPASSASSDRLVEGCLEGLLGVLGAQFETRVDGDEAEADVSGV